MKDMHHTHLKQWSFTATPRELQFFVVGVAAGAAALGMAFLASNPAPIVFVGNIVLAAVFFALGVARS